MSAINHALTPVKSRKIPTNLKNVVKWVYINLKNVILPLLERMENEAKN